MTEIINPDTENTDEQVNSENQNTQSESKTFSQEDVDKIINQRLKREKQKMLDQIEDERKKAAMDESERLKVEKLEIEKKLTDIQAKANQKAINSELKVLAANAGVKAEKMAHLLKLVDTSGIEIDEDGEPNTSQIKTAFDAVIKYIPEFLNTPTNAKAGSEFNSGEHISSIEQMKSLLGYK